MGIDYNDEENKELILEAMKRASKLLKMYAGGIENYAESWSIQEVSTRLDDLIEETEHLLGQN